MVTSIKIKVLGTDVGALQATRLLHSYVESSPQCHPRTLVMQCIDENNISYPVFVNDNRVYSLKNILESWNNGLVTPSIPFIVFYKHRINNSITKEDLIYSSKEDIVNEIKKIISTIDKKKYPDIKYILSKIIDMKEEIK